MEWLTDILTNIPMRFPSSTWEKIKENYPVMISILRSFFFIIQLHHKPGVCLPEDGEYFLCLGLDLWLRRGRAGAAVAANQVPVPSACRQAHTHCWKIGQTEWARAALYWQCMLGIKRTLAMQVMVASVLIRSTELVSVAYIHKKKTGRVPDPNPHDFAESRFRSALRFLDP